MRFVMLYDGFKQFIPADIHAYHTYIHDLCNIACRSCNIFTAGQIRVKSDRCPRVCYYYAEMLRLIVVQKMRDVSSETPMCYD